MYNYKWNGLPHEIYLNIFDKVILSILLCGSEILGFKYSDKIERVQQIFCKKNVRIIVKYSKRGCPMPCQTTYSVDQHCKNTWVISVEVMVGKLGLRYVWAKR